MISQHFERSFFYYLLARKETEAYNALSMAAELRKLAQDLEAAGHKQGARVLRGITQGLERADLIPPHLPEKTIWTPENIHQQEKPRLHGRRTPIEGGEPSKPSGEK